MSKDSSTFAQGKENKSSYISQLNTSENQRHQEYCNSTDQSKDIKVAAPILGKSSSIDDYDEDIPNEEIVSTANASDNQDNASSITNSTLTKTSSEFHSNSLTSSTSSNMNIPISSLSMHAVSSKQSLDTFDVSHGKSKQGIRNFFRKFFGSSSNKQGETSISIDSVNIDFVHSTAYPLMSPLPVTQGPIRLFVLRHGERLDRYYSSQWLRQAFDEDGNYCRFSPILPETLPFRASIRDFDLDPPLTYKGLKDAYHTGTVLKEKDIHIHYCYSSPAIRCVQTAAKILEGLQLHNKIKIRIEPGLFECTSWYTTNETNLTMPQFMTKKELVDNKYPIDKTYHEQMTIPEVSQYETELEFYERSHAVAAAILKMHENEFISQIQQGHASSQHHVHILFIAHAPTLETCTRKLCGGKFRPDTLSFVIRNVDFLTMTVVEKTDNNCDKWIFRRSSFYGEDF